MIRTVFLGTASIACPVLKVLHEIPEVTCLGVISQPDRPQGRKLRLTPTPIKVLAEELGIPVRQPGILRKDQSSIDWLRSLDLDVAIVMAYGQLLPSSVLQLPRMGCLNIHTSILPKYRGAAPIQWAIWNGDSVTGVTLMKMDEGMDTGPIVTTSTIPISERMTSSDLHDQLSEMGAELIRNSLMDYCRGKLNGQPQPKDGVSHARKIVKSDGALDWSHSADVLDRQVRALTPWPGCFTNIYLENDKSVRLNIKAVKPLGEPSGRPGEILQADKTGFIVATGKGSLQLLEVQRPGGKSLSASVFLLGTPLKVGTILGCA